MKNEEFQIVWVDQPNCWDIKLKKFSREKYTCICHTEKTRLPFRDWVEMKKKRAPEGNKGLFIYNILPCPPIEIKEECITENAYLIRCDWINKPKQR